MKYDISKFEELVDQGYLRKSERFDLTLYGYTDKCTYDKFWNEYTTVARGLILDKNGETVAIPFKKFFNLNEQPETYLSNLPKVPYKAFEKVDGSLGILFFYDNEWQIATRGSFYSEQAIKGKELLKKYDLSILPHNFTILIEIIYPENKIIVNYGKEEKLVMLAIFCNQLGHEYSHHTASIFANNIGMEIVKSYDYTIEQMIELQKTLSKDEEGFVVRFDNGLRIKIKGEEYMRIAKMISHMSPISFWESMVDGVVNSNYLAQLPEEFKCEYEPIVDQLESQYLDVMAEVVENFLRLPLTENDHRERAEGTVSGETRKKIGLFLLENESKDIKHKKAMFSFLLGKFAELDKYIMKYIRPDGNALRSME